MKRILITGGAGFIGCNFARWLHDHYPDYHVTVVDALTYAGNMQNCLSGADRYEFRHGDVRNAELVDALVSATDVVMHMAAESHVTRSIHDARLFFETDVIGTQTVTDAVVKYKSRIERFVHVSSSEVYGTALTPLMEEDHPLHPMSPYAAAKCGADRLVYSYWATHRIPATIVRPFNNFGPYQHLEKLLPRFITSCLLGEPLTVHGDGSAARDWLFVEDHCEALDRLLHAPLARVAGEVINVGTGRHRSVLDVAHAVRNAMDAAHCPIVFVADRPGQVVRHTCDASKAGKLLDWRPRTTFEEGLARTIRWYRDNEPWWRPLVPPPIIAAGGKREMP